MQCLRCQRKNSPDAKFCNGCGIPLAGTGLAKAYAELKDENELLRRSLSEAQQQETATSDILRAISEAQTDAQPVFDAIARSTVRLCDAARSTVWRPEGNLFRAVARWAMTPDGHVVRAPGGEALDADSLPGRAIREREILRVNDVPENPTVPPECRERARIRGYRSLVAVPMVCEGLAVGVITVVRPTSAEFSDHQVGLVKTFAHQAVIAIENVRLFQELQTRTQELTRSVGELRALGEVSQAVSSTLDLGTVLETIVSRAVELSGSDQGIVYEFNETSQIFHARATHRITPEHLATVRAVPIRLGDGAIGRAGVIRVPVQVADVQDESQPVAPPHCPRQPQGLEAGVAP